MESTDSNTIGQVRVDIGRLEGMLSQVISDYGRRITDAEVAHRQLRVDLTAVNDNLGARLAEVNTRVVKNTENVSELRTDITEINFKQNATLGRAMAVLSPLIALASFAYSAFVASKI